MREAGKLCELQAQLKKAGVLNAKGNFNGPADTKQASGADCPCGRCQRCNSYVKDCFDVEPVQVLLVDAPVSSLPMPLLR
eukprot:895162-Rhodomonas_salina.1